MCFNLNILKIYLFYMTLQSRVILRRFHSFWLGMIFGEHRFQKKTHSTQQSTRQRRSKWCSIHSRYPLTTPKIPWERPQLYLLINITNMTISQLLALLWVIKHSRCTISIQWICYRKTEKTEISVCVFECLKHYSNTATIHCKTKEKTNIMSITGYKCVVIAMFCIWRLQWQSTSTIWKTISLQQYDKCEHRPCTQQYWKGHVDTGFVDSAARIFSSSDKDGYVSSSSSSSVSGVVNSLLRSSSEEEEGGAQDSRPSTGIQWSLHICHYLYVILQVWC
jgi:hypothetical protein